MPAGKKLTAVSPLALGLLGLLAATPPPTPVSAAPPPVTFAVPTVSGIQGYGFEQNMRIDPVSGIVYTSAPNSLSSLTSWVWRSLDGGQTFKWVAAEVQPQGKPPTCVGGGDSELAVDSAGHLYLNDLTLLNFSTSRSDDGGKTFTASCTGVPAVGVDRQWYATSGDPTNGGLISLAYDQIAQTNPLQCPGGTAAPTGQNILVINLSPAVPGAGATAGIQFGPAQVLSCDEGIMGNTEFHDYGSGGGLKAFVVHDSSALNSVTMSRCDVPGISPTSPTGFSNCSEFPIATFPGSVTGGSFATMTVDRAGNVYAIWEQAPGAQGKITGNTALMFASSTDKGQTWTVRPIPTPGLLNNVFAWPGAGDSGKLDVAWYGTSQHFMGTSGPDSTNGLWGLYASQSLDGGLTWSAPQLASEHHIHSGTIQTLMGGQTGDRTLGDYLNLRIGAKGEANISYSDSNNIDEFAVPQAMFVRQSGGPSVFDGVGTVNLPVAPNGHVLHERGHATFDSAGVVGANNPNLDILASTVTQSDPGHYRMSMELADLTSLAPPNTGAGTDLVWSTQWHVPSTTDPTGGKIFHVYMESQNGQAPSCFVGENAALLNGGGVLLTYPGNTQLTGEACQYTAAAPGSVIITVPTSAVNEAGAVSRTLYSVTASTQILSAPANSVPSSGGIGGVPPSLVDVAPAYDYVPGSQAQAPGPTPVPTPTPVLVPLPNTSVPAPLPRLAWLGPLLVAALAFALARRRRPAP
ncbi:MAG: hypothetical protein ACYDGR_10090 [Candidatus Dormibacteria bacterium]